MKPNVEERVRKAILVVLSAAMVAYLIVRQATTPGGPESSVSSDRSKAFLFAAGSPPKDRVDCGDSEGAGDLPANPHLVAVFADSSRARVRLSDAVVVRFRRLGPIAWLPIPDNLEAELDKPVDEASLDFSAGRDPGLHTEATKLGAERVFVHDPARGTQVVYDLEATAPSAKVAKGLAEDLRDAFSLSFLSLSAPWEPELTKSSTHALARRTLRRATEAASDAFRSAFRGRLSGASDTFEAAERSKVAMEGGRMAAIAALDELLEEARAHPDELDEAILGVELSMLRTRSEDRGAASIARGNELRRRLGVRSSTVAPAALMGLVETKSDTLRLGMVTLTDPSRNLPAMVGWLCRKGLTDLRLTAVPIDE